MPCVRYLNHPHNDPQYVILEPINQVENNDSYMLTLNRELQADSYTESQGNSFSVTFSTEIPSGYFKYNISKVISTAHFSSTFFPPFLFTFEAHSEVIIV